MSKSKGIVPLERIERSILILRGEKVILDADLARLYGVKLKALNQAVKRNATRFPPDFMFQLSPMEAKTTWSHFVTKSGGVSAHRNYRPYAFTELGVGMLSSVLRSPRAVQVNIEIIRAFVELRRLVALRANWSRRLDEVERRIGKRLAGHDHQFALVFAAIRKLVDEDEHNPTLGFARDRDDDKGKRG
jgi:hypothetical protein